MTETQYKREMLSQAALFYRQSLICRPSARRGIEHNMWMCLLASVTGAKAVTNKEES